jgi:hypothetical protein
MFSLPNIVASPAYLESDIRWQSFDKDQATARVKRISYFLLLVFVSFVLLTPVNIVYYVKPLSDVIQKVASITSWT